MTLSDSAAAATLRHVPQLEMMSPPQADEVVRIDSLAAALAKLNVNIPIEDLIKVIHDSDGEETHKSKSVQVSGSDNEFAQ